MEELQVALNAKLKKIQDLYYVYETMARECDPFKYLLAHRYYDRDELAVYEVEKAYGVYLDMAQELIRMLRMVRAQGCVVDVFSPDGSLIGENEGIFHSYMDRIMPVQIAISKFDGALIVKEHILDVGHFEVKIGF